MKQIAMVGDLQTQAQQHRIGSMLDVFAALTPDQRSQLRAKMGEWRKHKGDRGKGRGKGRGRDRGDDDHGGDDDDDDR
jgi:Spy/CpxP family protein refolding chaperone